MSENPFESPEPGMVIEPELETLSRDYGGMGRVRYLLYSILTVLVGLVGFGIFMVLIPPVSLFVLILMLGVLLAISAARIMNIGWPVGLVAIPGFHVLFSIVFSLSGGDASLVWINGVVICCNFFFGILLLAIPEGFVERKRLDVGSYVVFGLSGIFVTMAVIGMIVEAR